MTNNLKVDRGADCIENMKCCRGKAANEAKKFIPDSASILTHGHSRAVKDVLMNAHVEGKIKRIYYTKATDGSSGMSGLFLQLFKIYYRETLAHI